MPLARSIGYNILKGLAGERLTLGKMISIARQAGGGYRYQNMLEDARKFTGRVKYQTQIERLGYDAVVPKAFMVETELEQTAKYRVFGQVTLYDEESDSYLTQNASFYTDDLDTVGNYGQAFENFYAGRYDEQDLEIAEFKQTGIEHNRGWDY